MYKDIDICLDTYPYNGVTTTFEALWMNVPVITKKGYNFNSRCGESILINANLENLIASSDEDYFDKAVYFSNNLDELEKLRKNLFENVLDTPLFLAIQCLDSLTSVATHTLPGKPNSPIHSMLP